MGKYVAIHRYEGTLQLVASAARRPEFPVIRPKFPVRRPQIPQFPPAEAAPPSRGDQF